MNEARNDPEALARLLDRSLPPNTREVVGSTRDPLVSTAVQLARFVVPVPSQQFLQAGQERILGVYDRQQGRKRISHLNRQIVFTRLAAVAALVIVIFGSSLLSSASASLPGEPLYGVKRTLEAVELNLARGEAERADTLVRQAERRTDESLLLLRRSDFDAETVANALDLIAQADAVTSVGQSSLLNRRAEVVAITLNVVVKGAWETQLASASEIATLVTALRETEAIIQRPAQPGVGGQPPAVRPSPEIVPSGTPETAQLIPTASATPTIEVTNTRTPHPTETDDATNTPRPTRTPRPTNVPPATACPGGSCESAGRPGGQIDPAQPPGQSGGRDDNPADPPGQGNPPSNPGGGNGNGNGGGNGNRGGG
jgi:hypothetical protein